MQKNEWGQPATLPSMALSLRSFFSSIKIRRSFCSPLLLQSLIRISPHPPILFCRDISVGTSLSNPTPSPTPTPTAPSSHKRHNRRIVAPSKYVSENLAQRIMKAVRRPGTPSKARVYADVNAQRDREYWDYESFDLKWRYVCDFVCVCLFM